MHGDIGGGTKAKQGKYLSDIALAWMAREAGTVGLALETHLHGLVTQHHQLPLNRSYKSFYKVLGKSVRRIPDDGWVHRSVVKRYQAGDYAPTPLKSLLDRSGGNWPNIED